MEIDKILFVSRLETYGFGYKLPMEKIKKGNILISFFIIGIYPIFLSMVINKYVIPKQYTIRYLNRFCYKHTMGWEKRKGKI